MARFGALAFQSAGGLARRRFRGPRARALFAGVAAHSVLPLDRTPSAAIGMMLQLAAHGVGWPMPRGGAQSVATALMGVLTDLGGEVRLSTPITALDQVETDGPILFDTGPVALTRVAGDRLPDSYRRRVEAFRYGPGAFKVDWALSGPIPWADPAVARAGTVHLGGTLEALEISERAPWEGAVAARPYVLLVQHSVADPTRAPEGHHVAWAYVHVPPHDDRDLTHLVEDSVERAAPGFRGRVLARATTSARDLERLNPNYIGGDVNGGAADWDQLFTRPVWQLRPYRTPDPRLYLCSASTPPGGGVHGMCGWHAAEAALATHPPPSPRTTDGAAPR
jgi:phytoene dehydrogenase-like protein